MNKSISPLHSNTRIPVLNNRVIAKAPIQSEVISGVLQKNQTSYRELRENKTQYELKKKQTDTTPVREQSRKSNKENMVKTPKDRDHSPIQTNSVATGIFRQEAEKKIKKPIINNVLPKQNVPLLESSVIVVNNTATNETLKQQEIMLAQSSAISKNIVKRFEAFAGQLQEEKKKFYKKISDRKSKYSLILDSREDMSMSKFPYEEVEESQNMQKLMELPVEELIRTLRSTKGNDSGDCRDNNLLSKHIYLLFLAFFNNLTSGCLRTTF